MATAHARFACQALVQACHFAAWTRRRNDAGEASWEDEAMWRERGRDTSMNVGGIHAWSSGTSYSDDDDDDSQLPGRRHESYQRSIFCMLTRALITTSEHMHWLVCSRGQFLTRIGGAWKLIVLRTQGRRCLRGLLPGMRRHNVECICAVRSAVRA